MNLIFQNQFLQIIVLLFAATFLKQLFKKVHLPYSPLLFLFTLILAIFLHQGDQPRSSLLSLLYESKSLLLVILPPLIFQIGYQYDWRSFKRFWKSTIYFIFVGNLLNFLLLSVFLYLFSGLKMIGIAAILLLPSNPQIYKKLLIKTKFKPLIRVLSGEQAITSVISTIVCIEIVNPIQQNDYQRGVKLFNILIISPAIGLAFGLLMNRFIKKVVIDTVSAAALTIFSMYLSYALAERDYLTGTGVGSVCVIILSISSRLLKSNARTEQIIKSSVSIVSRILSTLIIMESAIFSAFIIKRCSLYQIIFFNLLALLAVLLLVLSQAATYLIVQKANRQSLNMLEMGTCCLNASRGSLSLLLCLFYLTSKNEQIQVQAMIQYLVSSVYLVTNLAHHFIIKLLQKKLNVQTFVKLKYRNALARSSTANKRVALFALDNYDITTILNVPWPACLPENLRVLTYPQQFIEADLQSRQLSLIDEMVHIEIRFMIATAFIKQLQLLKIQQQVREYLYQAAKILAQEPELPLAFTCYLKKELLGLKILDFGLSFKIIDRFVSLWLINQVYITYMSHMTLNKLLGCIEISMKHLSFRKDVKRAIEFQLQSEISLSSSVISFIQSNFQKYLSIFQFRQVNMKFNMELQDLADQFFLEGILQDNWHQEFKNSIQRNQVQISLVTNIRDEKLFSRMRSMPIFRALSEQQFKIIKAKTIQFQCPEKYVIISQESKIKNLLLLEKGVVNVIQQSKRTLRGSGTFLDWRLALNQFASFTVISLSKCKLRLVPIKYIKKFIRENDKFLKELSSFLVATFSPTSNRPQLLEQLIDSQVKILKQGERLYLKQGFLVRGKLIHQLNVSVRGVSNSIEQMSSFVEGQYTVESESIILQVSGKRDQESVLNSW